MHDLLREEWKVHLAELRAEHADLPMRNHALMQTIARANRVFPDKENGLIVDYIGVFRERALAIYGAATGDDRVESPIQDKERMSRARSARRARFSRARRQAQPPRNAPKLA